MSDRPRPRAGGRGLDPADHARPAAWRDALDDLQRNLDIPPNTLTRRLNALIAAGLIERRRYSAHPPRDEYVPTASGRDFRPVLIALLAWGNRHFAPEGASVVLLDRATGRTVDPVLTDPVTGRAIEEPDDTLAAGPAASPRILRRYAHVRDEPPRAARGRKAGSDKAY